MTIALVSDNQFPKLILEEQGSDRPAAAAGERELFAKADGIYEVDDAGIVTGPFGTGGGGSGDASWTAPTLTNSWVNFGAPYQTAGYRKDANGFVHLKGLIKSGVIGSAAFTLPAGYRPAADAIFAVISNSAFGRLNITSAGAVTPASPSANNNVSLDTVPPFLAEL